MSSLCLARRKPRSGQLVVAHPQLREFNIPDDHQLAGSHLRGVLPGVRTCDAPMRPRPPRWPPRLRRRNRPPRGPLLTAELDHDQPFQHAGDTDLPPSGPPTPRPGQERIDQPLPPRQLPPAPHGRAATQRHTPSDHTPPTTPPRAGRPTSRTPRDGHDLQITVLHGYLPPPSSPTATPSARGGPLDTGPTRQARAQPGETSCPHRQMRYPRTGRLAGPLSVAAGTAPLVNPTNGARSSIRATRRPTRRPNSGPD